MQAQKVLGQDLLAGEAGLTLRTGVVLVTAKAVCRAEGRRFMGRKLQALLGFPLILKSH